MSWRKERGERERRCLKVDEIERRKRGCRSVRRSRNRKVLPSSKASFWLVSPLTSVDDTQSEISLRCYEDEWSRSELSVLVFSRDGCLSGSVIRSRWEQLSYTTQQAWPLPIDGEIQLWEALLIYCRLEPSELKCAGFTLLQHAVRRMRKWKKLFHPRVTSCHRPNWRTLRLYI